MNITGDYIVDVLDGMKEFCDEVGYTYFPERAYHAVIHYMEAYSCDILIEVVDGTAAAAAIVQYDDMYHYERTGLIAKFYVRKPYRGTPVARNLMKKVQKWFDDNDCIFSDAVVNGGLDVDPLTYNLFRKFGFENDGLRLRRYYNTM